MAMTLDQKILSEIDRVLGSDAGMRDFERQKALLNIKKIIGDEVRRRFNESQALRSLVCRY